MSDANLLEELKKLIEASHSSPEDDQLQETTIQKCFDYIASFPVDKHLFCNPDGYHAGIHALILFSFPDSDALTWYKQKIDQYLSSCQKCIFMFHQGKAKLRQKFLITRGLDFESVSQFTEMISIWESSRLLPILQQAYQAICAGSGSAVNSSLILTNNAMLALIECLCGPGMFKVNPELKRVFSHVFQYLIDSGTPFKLSNKLTPGVVYFLFEGTETEKKWAVDNLVELSNVKKLEPKEFNAALVEEYEVHLYNIQNPTFYNDETCSLFWRNIIPLINACTKETILQKLQLPEITPYVQKYFSYKLVPLAQVITNQIMSYQKQPLPFILRAFNALLVRLGSSFWGLVTPLIFNNFLDTIFGNPYYLKYIMELNNGASSGLLVNNSKATLNDLLYWINAMFNSLSNAQQQQAGARIADWFLKLSTDKQINIPEFTKSLLTTIACDLLTKCLDLEVPLYDLNFTVDLLVRVEARNLVDKRASLFVNTSFDLDYARNSDQNYNFLRSSCVKLVARCIQFDILNFSQNSYNAYKNSNSSLAPFSPILWETMLGKSFKRPTHQTANLTFLMISLLSALKGIPGILVVKSDLKNASQYSNILRYLNSLLSMFLEIDPLEMRTVLRNPEALDGLWSSILSPEQEISQSATSILYEAYDSTGRFEGIQSILKENFEYCLRSLTSSLSRTITCGFFEPCPRAVRVLMDVVNAANDPIKGMFNDPSKFNHITNKEFLQNFWNQCWDFLVFIYKETLKWATSYSAKHLVEFTRDTLDLSHLMLNCFKNVTLILSNDDISFRSKVEKQLFQKILNSFKSMMVWLRLSDSALLTLCVDLIFKTVDLAGELNLTFTDEVVELLAKYGSKAKKFNNKLTVEQVTEILSRARSFNEELVEKVITESEEHRKSSKPQLLAPSQSAKASMSPSPPISRTGKSDSAPPQKELSKLEKIKLDLRQNRAVSAKPLVIHPPSKPGFHSKRSKKTTSDSDDNSDSDSESGNDGIRELFMKNKKDKAKTTLLDKVSQIKSTNLKKPSLFSAVDEQKKREMSMRRRLNVNMDPFYRKVLSWSYSRKNDYPTDATDNYMPVKQSFDNSTQYQKIFEPLLLLECWQSICQSRELTQERPFEINIGSRSSVDNFFDVYTSVKKSILHDRRIGESDLMVIAYVKDINDPERISPSSLEKSDLNCLAKVREIKSANSDYSDVTLRILPNNNPMVPLITPQTTLVALKVTQMTTIEREYSSLFGLPYYDLVSNIIKAKPSYHNNVDEPVLNKMIKMYNVNKSQASAIYGSVNNKGFSLIQGPPGTGKTKTILGIVGYILTANSSAKTIKPVENTNKPVTLKKQKVLICAPSNAAVDELVLRLRSSIKDSEGNDFAPNVVRLGRSDAINTAVKDLTLEELVDKELGGREEENLISDSSIRQQHNKCLEERDKVREQLNQENLLDDKAVQLQLKLREIMKRKNDLGRKLDEQREKVSISYRNKEIERRNIQFKVLSNADIICSTLSGSAHDIVKGMNITCDTVIIDEACQCTELSAIIPLRYGCEKCIMVGDPNQLPPTVLSQAAASFNYEQSLFVRMQKNFPESVYLLDVQYRMHPDISEFPSEEFYQSRLVDGDRMAEINTRGWHSTYPLSPYRFFNTTGKQEQSLRSKSFFNTAEAEVALELVKRLEKISLDLKESIDGKIGIISPYKEQVARLKSVFIRFYGKPILNVIDFNTVDGFQGQEKEVIIMSCVRASGSSGVGFLSDVRRMNVGLTRAKTTLWVLGHKESLEQNKVWRHLIENAASRGLVTPAYPGFLKNIGSGPPKPYAPLVANTVSSNSGHAALKYNDDKYKEKKIKGEKDKSHKKKKKSKDKDRQKDKDNKQKEEQGVDVDYGDGPSTAAGKSKPSDPESYNVTSDVAPHSEATVQKDVNDLAKNLKRKPSSLFKPSPKSQKSNTMFAKAGLKQPVRNLPTIYSSNKAVEPNDIPAPKRTGTIPLNKSKLPTGPSEKKVVPSSVAIPRRTFPKGPRAARKPTDDIQGHKGPDVSNASGYTADPNASVGVGNPGNQNFAPPPISPMPPMPPTPYNDLNTQAEFAKSLAGFHGFANMVADTGANLLQGNSGNNMIEAMGSKNSNQSDTGNFGHSGFSSNSNTANSSNAKSHAVPGGHDYGNAPGGNIGPRSPSYGGNNNNTFGNNTRPYNAGQDSKRYGGSYNQGNSSYKPNNFNNSNRQPYGGGYANSYGNKDGNQSGVGPKGNNNYNKNDSHYSSHSGGGSYRRPNSGNSSYRNWKSNGNSNSNNRWN